MTTIAIPRRRIRAFRPAIAIESTPYSSLALASIGCIGLFISFILLYQFGIFDSVSFATTALWSSLFLIIAPALALVFSVMALRRYVKLHEQVRGMFLAYISFALSGIYFATALAMPIVFLGFYAVYVYIW
ncbi:MAG: hypothetical protein K0S38_214 [Candidatus Paceibacter sp.]|jgi:hypothetical protein|nr:hypothetical protein [Candidatus Paceibacter sp.]